jgi:hypothetical protein
MTVRIYAKHLPYEDGNLGKVFDEMELAGEPTIRVIGYGDYKKQFFALEGSHRLYLAHKYGMIPKIWVMTPDVELIDEDRYLSIIKGLPYYDFPHVYMLKEAKLFTNYEPEPDEQ